MSNPNAIDIEVRAKALLGDAQKQIAQFLGEVEKGTANAGKRGAVSMGELQNAFRNPLEGAKALGAEMGVGLVGKFGATAVAATAVAGAVVAVGAALVKAALDASSYGAALDDASEITGISVERLSVLKGAAEIAGFSLEQLTNNI